MSTASVNLWPDADEEVIGYMVGGVAVLRIGEAFTDAFDVNMSATMGRGAQAALLDRIATEATSLAQQVRDLATAEATKVSV